MSEKYLLWSQKIPNIFHNLSKYLMVIILYPLWKLISFILQRQHILYSIRWGSPHTHLLIAMRSSSFDRAEYEECLSPLASEPTGCGNNNAMLKSKSIICTKNQMCMPSGNLPWTLTLQHPSIPNEATLPAQHILVSMVLYQHSVVSIPWAFHQDSVTL